jgi:Uncharacterized protein conserved in bacteria
LLLAVFAWVIVPTLALAQTAPTITSVSGEPMWRYTVRPGDTLIGLGQRYLRDPAQWPQIQRDNRVGNPRQIPPGTVLLFPADLLRQQPSKAQLVQAFGAVRWRAQATEAWQDAKPGQTLAAGAQLQVPDSGSAVIELANGTRLALQPGSDLTLDTLSLYADGLMADTRLRLQQGQIDIQDNPRRLPNQNLRILTPSAQAVVRGTQFRVRGGRRGHAGGNPGRRGRAAGLGRAGAGGCRHGFAGAHGAAAAAAGAAVAAARCVGLAEPV